MAKTFDIDGYIAKLAKRLPPQGLITQFINQNTLDAYLDQPFHSALAQASSFFGAKAYPELKFYLKEFAKGRISKIILDAEIQKSAANKYGTGIQGFLKRSHQLERWFYRSRGSLRRDLYDHFALDVDQECHSLMIRLTSQFLDQGIAVAAFPNRNLGFWNAVRTLVLDTLIPLYPFDRQYARKFFSMPPHDCINEILARLFSSNEAKEVYLEDLILSLPGWASMICQLERDPSQLSDQRSVSLVEWLAIFMMIDFAYLAADEGGELDQFLKREPEYSESAEILAEVLTLSAIWHEAFEWSHYAPLLSGISAVSSLSPKSSVSSRPSAQFVVCLDDRMGSLRRYLEDIDPNCETYGVAGFFAGDFYLKDSLNGQIRKSCPIPVTPKHVIVQSPLRQRRQKKSIWHLSERRSSTFLMSWVRVQIYGWVAALRLLVGIFTPQVIEKSRMSGFAQPSQLDVRYSGKTEDGMQYGYSTLEMADRVENQFKAMGLTSNFAPWVVVVGHGSSSTNSPYFAVDDCGACSGRPGGENARVLCQMANDLDVRTVLEQRGLSISKDTKFLAGLVDTAADQIYYFSDDLPKPWQFTPTLFEIKNNFEQALALNAYERCRRFATFKLPKHPKSALKHVRRRVVSLFEPRSEYNHATNHSCVIGPRSTTDRLFLDRRTFLQSYNPSTDSSGSILKGLLHAVVPVCGGINLQYFFSRVDPDVYGAGSKLPQNVTGLIGVMTGLESDLRTGLPIQMTEIHDPVRLLIVVQQQADLLCDVIHDSPNIKSWLDHQWVRIVSFDPETKVIKQYVNGRMEVLADCYRSSKLPMISPDSRGQFFASRDNLGVAIKG